MDKFEKAKTMEAIAFWSTRSAPGHSPLTAGDMDVQFIDGSWERFTETECTSMTFRLRPTRNDA